MPRTSAARRPVSDRARETRKRLLRAGRAAFARKGLTGANLKSDILGPASVSVGSFYHQFSDKTDLLLAILADHSERFRARVREVHRPRPGRTLEQLVGEAYELLFADAESNRDLLHIQLRERYSGSRRVRDFLRADRERWIRSLAENFALVQEAAGLPPATDSAPALILSLAHGAIARFIETPDALKSSTRARLVDDLVQFTIGGMPALRGSPGAPRTLDQSPTDAP